MEKTRNPHSVEETKALIKEQGYVIIENLLSKQECTHFKELLENDCKKYTPKYARPKTASTHGLENKSHEKVVFNLHNKHLDYYKLFEHPRVLEILDATLKDGSYQNAEPYNLINISARCPLENSKGQQLHLDSNLPGGEFPLIMIALWMLDDFTENNGATRIIPKSHKILSYAENGVKYPNELCVTAPQGSVLIYHASLWHGSNDKSTPDDRWAVVLGYGRWFIKPSFDFMKNMPIEIYEKLSPAQKDLLGYRSAPPKDEFTRMRRRSEEFEIPIPYSLPK